MKKLFVKAVSFSALIILLTCGVNVYSLAGDSDSDKALPEGVYLKLNRDFYESLNSDRNSYSNNRSAEYLREISISSKFIVETNLQIIKQQEEIIRLLKNIADKKK